MSDIEKDKQGATSAGNNSATQESPEAHFAEHAESASVTGSGRNVVSSDEMVGQEIARKSRRSFLVGGIAAAAAFGGWRWLGSRQEIDGLPFPLRRAHEFNERLSRKVFDSSRLAPTFPRERARMPRVNGGEGMSADFDPATWQLRVTGLQGSDSEMILSLDDIRALPRVEMTTELKCIEGWSEVVHWAGARFADFADAHAPATRGNYVGLETPDGGYYVGLDMESARHPQTLLCYEMDGKPLTLEHGAPLRLYIPVKYGIKSIKRIGTISFTDTRPRDFWAEGGYDWYSGH